MLVILLAPVKPENEGGGEINEKELVFSPKKIM